MQPYFIHFVLFYPRSFADQLRHSPATPIWLDSDNSSSPYAEAWLMSEMSPHSPILVVFPTPTKRQPTSSKTLQAKRMIQYARSLALSIQKIFIIYHSTDSSTWRICKTRSWVHLPILSAFVESMPHCDYMMGRLPMSYRHFPMHSLHLIYHRLFYDWWGMTFECVVVRGWWHGSKDKWSRRRCCDCVMWGRRSMWLFGGECHQAGKTTWWKRIIVSC